MLFVNYNNEIYLFHCNHRIFFILYIVAFDYRKLKTWQYPEFIFWRIVIFVCIWFILQWFLNQRYDWRYFWMLPLINLKYSNIIISYYHQIVHKKDCKKNNHQLYIKKDYETLNINLSINLFCMYILMITTDNV